VFEGFTPTGFLGLAAFEDTRSFPFLDFNVMSVAAFFDGPLSKDFDGLPTSASRAL
jgi:hypothetical protein